MNAANELTHAAFEDLYRATAGELFGYLRRQVGDEAPDLLAEVFVVAWRRRDDLPAPYLRRAWLYGAARRLCAAEHRRSAREAAVIAAAEILSTQDVDEAPLDETEAAERRRAVVVRTVMGRLEPLDQELLQLSEWDGMTSAEVGVVVGMKASAVRVRLHRARLVMASDPELRRVVAASVDV